MVRPVVLALLFCLSASGQEPASIRGHTYDSLTGQPLSRVHIRLLVPSRGEYVPAAWGALSDQEGRFSIASIPPGTYLVQALRAGYFYLPKAKDGPPQPGVTLKPGQHLEDFRMALAPHAVLTGRVLTEDGYPVQNAQVTREPASDSDFPLVLALQMVGNPWANIRNERGEFRFSVPPGKYRLRVQGGSIDEIQPDGLLTQGFYPDIYYPAARDEKSATVVEAVAGRETSGLDIRIAAAKPLSIGGTVAGVPASATAAVFLQWERQSQATDLPIAPDGSYLSKYLQPGTYYVWAATPGGADKLRSPTEVVELTDSPVRGLMLPLRRLARVTGTLQLPAGTPNASRLVRLQPADGGFERRRAGAITAPVAKDGSFAIEGVEPERYQVTLVPMPENGYIQSLLPDELVRDWQPAFRFSTAGAVSDIMAPLDLRGGAEGTRLKMVVARGGAISGKIVRTDAGTPHDLEGVMIIPDGRKEEDDLIRVPIETDGSYHVRGLPPGKYRLLFLDALAAEPGAGQSLEKMLARAEVVELKDGDHLTRDFDPSKKGDGDVKQ